MDNQNFSPYPLISILILSIMTSCSSPQSKNSFQESNASSSAQGGSSMEVIRKTLDNGLTIQHSPNSEEPRFYAEIVTRAGSKHDPATNTLAHYLEHLLFKGTQSFGTLDYEKEQPLLDQIVELYEQRSGETNESKKIGDL